jgi:Zn-dependent oligopeptidase
MDPRVKASAADIKLQYDTSRAIDALLRRSRAALAEIAKANKTSQITDLEQRLTRASQPLGQLFSAVEQIDAAPTPVVISAWKSASTAVESALREWEQLRGR